jgi:cobalamin biosynthesis Mg chelatase CobN
MAKRRGLATLVSYLTPPIANAGLYKDLATLKASVDRFRQREGEVEAGDPLVQMIQEQGAALELCAARAGLDARDRARGHRHAARAAAGAGAVADPAGPAHRGRRHARRGAHRDAG